MSYAQEEWYQKVTMEVTVPRKVDITFSRTKLSFGVVEDTAIETLTITNKNGYMINLLWTAYNIPEGLRMTVENAINEILMDNTVMSLSPGESITLDVTVINESAQADAGTDVTHTWTVRFYYAA